MSDVSNEMTLKVEQEIEVAASAERTFQSVLANLGELFGPGEQSGLNMKLEPWVGGRWFRDLGDGQGHLWGHVQVMKRGKLLELYGPMFMSYPAVSHLQLKLTEKDGRTILTLRHQALGLIDPEHRKGVAEGWDGVMKGVKTHAEHP